MLRAILVSSVLAAAALGPALVSEGGFVKSNGVTQAPGRGKLDIRLEAEAGTVAYYSNGKFHADYRERVRDGELKQSFDVEVEGFTPNVEVPMRVNGIFVGNFYVNALGRGEMQFDSVDEDPGDSLPLPGGFPRLRAGDTVSVGVLTTVWHGL